MMYYYSKVNDITMTHSEVLEEKDIDYIAVHFERPNEKGFDFLDLKLPGEFVVKSYGFSEDEKYLLQSSNSVYGLRKNCHLSNI